MIDSKTIFVTAILFSLMGTTASFAMEEEEEEALLAGNKVNTRQLFSDTSSLEEEGGEWSYKPFVGEIKPPELNAEEFVTRIKSKLAVSNVCKLVHEGDPWIRATKPNAKFKLHKTLPHEKYMIEWVEGCSLSLLLLKQK